MSSRPRYGCGPTVNYALEPEEIEKGYVLTGQAHPASEKVVLDYDA